MNYFLFCVFSALPYFLFSFYFLFISSKWDINRRHSFTNRRMFSTANIANYNNFSKVMFGLQVAVRLNIPSYYSFACSLFLENLEKRSKSKVRNIKMRFHEKKNKSHGFFRFLIQHTHFISTLLTFLAFTNLHIYTALEIAILYISIFQCCQPFVNFTKNS